jgi:uncharacterized protein DUF2844
MKRDTLAKARTAACAALALSLLAVAPSAAWAALGAAESTVQADGTALRANVQVTRGAAYAVHEMVMATGTRVREYASSGGVVYGVTWQGPFMPDLRQLLGTHFDAYAQSAHRIQVGRSLSIVTEATLVVESSGHMRFHQGRAYLTDTVPAGVSIESIQ